MCKWLMKSSRLLNTILSMLHHVVSNYTIQPYVMLTKDYMYFTSKLDQIFYTHQKPKRPGQKERPMYHIGTNQTIHAQKWYLSKQPTGTGYTTPTSLHRVKDPMVRRFHY